MRLGLKALAIATALVGAGQVLVQAQQMPSAADRAAVEKTIVTNENKINDAFAKSDVATMKAMIAPDAVTVGPDGVSPVADFFKQMPTMAIKVTEQQMTNFKFVWADANTVVATYTWTGKGTAMGQPMPSPVYGATVWAKRGATWVPVFHQETAAQAMPMPGAKPAAAGTAGAKPAPGR